MRRLALAAAFIGGLAMLAGCSHSCVPHGWYQAKSAPGLKSPPNGPPLAHDPTYDISGKPPSGPPTHEEACLTQPPNALKAAAAASAAKLAATPRAPSPNGLHR